MIDELGISAVIDEALPKTRNHILPHSKVVTAMLLNGLGFNERRLYFFSRFFNNLSKELLFGPGVTPGRERNSMTFESSSLAILDTYEGEILPTPRVEITF